MAVSCHSPPSTVRDHYGKLLGPVYSWMIGDIDAAMTRADGELEAMDLPGR
jgi:hypothetical protein